MTPDELRVVTGWVVAIGFLLLCHQLYWQVRASYLSKVGSWLSRLRQVDRQTYSAFFFLLSTALVMGQLMLSYLGVVAFGTTNRGPVFFFLWVGTLAWWSWCTSRHNVVILRRRRDARKLRKPLP